MSDNPIEAADGERYRGLYRISARILSAGLRDLHVMKDDGSGINTQWCCGCGDDYPCPTTRELDRIEKLIKGETT